MSPVPEDAIPVWLKEPLRVQGRPVEANEADDRKFTEKGSHPTVQLIFRKPLPVEYQRRRFTIT